MTGWTRADQAELEVLVHALTTGYQEHRTRCQACQPCPGLERWREHKATCRACQGDAPLTFGRPCERRDHWLEHTRVGCLRCLPCPSLVRVVAEVCDWRNARALLSRAEAMRRTEGGYPGITTEGPTAVFDPTFGCCVALLTELDGVDHIYHRRDCEQFGPGGALGESAS